MSTLLIELPPGYRIAGLLRAIGAHRDDTGHRCVADSDFEILKIVDARREDCNPSAGRAPAIPE